MSIVHTDGPAATIVQHPHALLSNGFHDGAVLQLLHDIVCAPRVSWFLVHVKKAHERIHSVETTGALLYFSSALLKCVQQLGALLRRLLHSLDSRQHHACLPDGRHWKPNHRRNEMRQSEGDGGSES
eukprot:CAMPEP_0119071032 /NCGR_PEP_ID=MMETSP1178-20130426/47548_1 /TAXON_ID=33656 /ORGANISM="unid sp, Strain CCMP2000" /LENGTH=126 /DNA_ID=CAMNT_0007052923 /DNA_START=74 /DNA_END=454 /DNA_ORIENTATION=+